MNRANIHKGFEPLLSLDRLRDQSVWSVAFKDVDPKKLKKDHEAMVEQLYGGMAKRRIANDTLWANFETN